MERDIDMGQTIEEAARIERERIILELHADYKIHGDARHYVISSTVIGKYGVNLFKAGAEWQAKQSLWISVKDKLPYDIQGDKLLIRYLGKYGYDICIGMFIENGNFIDKSGNDVYNVIQYMPIPSLDEILESSQRCAETD